MPYVLVVEDDRDSGEALERLMRRAGYEARWVPNGREALAALSADPLPDLILLDLLMPEMDGAGLVTVIRSYLRWQSLPVILVTAYPEFPRVAGLYAQGVRDVFRKGEIDYAELLDCVRRRIGEAGQNPPSEDAAPGQTAARPV